MSDTDRLRKERGEREAQIARILKRVEERLRKELPSGPQTLEQIERDVHELGEEIKQDIQEEVVDALGSGHTGPTLRCDCGSVARYRGDAVRSVITLQGAQVIARAYYYCPSCRHGFHPLDRALALGRGPCSVGVWALACRFASYLPYAVAAQELEMVCGIRLSASSIQRVAKQTGRTLMAEWAEREKRLRTCPNSPNAEPTGTAPKQLHISMDGVMAHVDGGWREVKLGVCYERSQEGGGPSAAAYYATLDPSEQFGRRLRALSWVAKEPLCRQVAVLADGSDWIWKEAAKHFTRRTQILDFFHASEHLWTVARARFAGDAAGASGWIDRQKARLMDNRVTEVVEDVRSWQPDKEADREVRRKELAYLAQNAGRMKYKTYKDAGFHIGSGVMESSCRWVVQQRMKGAGMRWSRQGAESMLHLRTAWCSRKPSDLIDAARRAAVAA
jgi:hypothetical protein